MDLLTFPSMDLLEENSKHVPKHMYPNMLPHAVVYEAYLDDAQCDTLIKLGESYEYYNHRGCGATTREFDRPLNSDMHDLLTVVMQTNLAFWNYIVDPGAGAWLQTYEKDGNYENHTDTFPGQMRKLTAVALLSRPTDYLGGDLEIHAPPLTYLVPRSRGTIVVFQPWLHHKVTRVHSGVRQTINLGFWGPNFR